MRKGRRLWSLAEYEQAVALRAAGVTFDEIGCRLGRPRPNIAARLEAGPPKYVGPGGGGVHTERVSEIQAQDRDRRNLAAHARDLTGTLCGDPPPGFSALDRRCS